MCIRDRNEADHLAGSDPDFHTRDLYEHVERKAFPSWTLYMQIMPFGEADAYRFNPFDLTKTISHSDYPLTEVGRMVLDENPVDYHSQIEQAAFSPSNMVPGIGPSPDKMLLARTFSYADAHRYRIGVNYNQLPVNEPRNADVRSYTKDGHMRYRFAPDPVYAPNSKGGPRADVERFGEPAGWHAEGELTRSPYSLHAEDDDFGQPGTLVRDVMDDAARDRLVDNTVKHLLDGVGEPVLERSFEYLRNVDPEYGRRVEEGVRAQQ